MRARSTNRVTTTLVVTSGLLLIASISGAWYVHSLQTQAHFILEGDVDCLQLAEELLLGVRDVRHDLNLYLRENKAEHLEHALGLKPSLDKSLDLADMCFQGLEERECLSRLRQGVAATFRRLSAVEQSPLATGPDPAVDDLVSTLLSQDVVPDAQKLLDISERQAQQSSAGHRDSANQLAIGLALLGICGAASGLVAGFTAAKALSRSIFELSIPIRDVAGKLNEVVGEVTVVSNPDAHDLECVLRAISEQVTAVVEQLHARQREVLRADQLAAVGQLAAGLAHELRNPLMCMKVLVHVAVRRGAEAHLEGQDLHVLNEEISRLEQLLQAFLDFARPTALEKKTVDIRSVIQQTLALITAKAERRNVTISCRLPSEPICIECDALQIRQLLLNMLLNSLDAVRNYGHIWLEIELEDDSGENSNPTNWLRIAITDNGRGLPETDRHRIYEPFFSTRETGLGMGLAICKRIVEAHGGQLIDRNRPEGGAQFIVKLAACQPVSSAESVA